MEIQHICGAIAILAMLGLVGIFGWVVHRAFRAAGDLAEERQAYLKEKKHHDAAYDAYARGDRKAAQLHLADYYELRGRTEKAEQCRKDAEYWS